MHEEAIPPDPFERLSTHATDGIRQRSAPAAEMASVASLRHVPSCSGSKVDVGCSREQLWWHEARDGVEIASNGVGRGPGKMKPKLRHCECMADQLPARLATCSCSLCSLWWTKHRLSPQRCHRRRQLLPAQRKHEWNRLIESAQ